MQQDQGRRGDLHRFAFFSRSVSSAKRWKTLRRLRVRWCRLKLMAAAVPCVYCGCRCQQPGHMWAFLQSGGIAQAIHKAGSKRVQSWRSLCQCTDFTKKKTPVKIDEGLWIAGCEYEAKTLQVDSIMLFLKEIRAHAQWRLWMVHYG